MRKIAMREKVSQVSRFMFSHPYVQTLKASWGADNI